MARFLFVNIGNVSSVRNIAGVISNSGMLCSMFFCPKNVICIAVIRPKNVVPIAIIRPKNVIAGLDLMAGNMVKCAA